MAKPTIRFLEREQEAAESFPGDRLDRRGIELTEPPCSRGSWLERTPSSRTMASIRYFERLPLGG